MKIALVCILALAGCALALAYQTHRDLGLLQKECADLTTANKSLENENGILESNTKTFSDDIAQLKNENSTITANIKSLTDQVTQLNGEIPQLKTAPAETTATPPATGKHKKTKKAPK